VLATLQLLQIIVEVGALGLLAFIVIKGLPALMTVKGLFLQNLIHQNRTIAKLAKAVIHLAYKVKNPEIDNDEELQEIEAELDDHMRNMPPDKIEKRHDPSNTS